MVEERPDFTVRFWNINPDDFTKDLITRFRIGFGIGGVAALLVGALLAFRPGQTIEAIALMLGIYLVVAGIVRAISGFAIPGLTGGQRALSVVLGALYVVGGVVMVMHMPFAGAALAVFVGIMVGVAWIIEGIMTLTIIDSGRGRGWAIAYGIISIIAGVFVCFSPAWSTVLLTVFAGASLLVMGVICIYRAFTFGKDRLKHLK